MGQVGGWVGGPAASRYQFPFAEAVRNRCGVGWGVGGRSSRLGARVGAPSSGRSSGLGARGSELGTAAVPGPAGDGSSEAAFGARRSTSNDRTWNFPQDSFDCEIEFLYLRSRMKQGALFKNSKKEYGGDLYKTRRGRQGPRPLATRSTMHLVLKSSRAKSDHSFRKPKHAQAIKRIVSKFSARYGVRLISLANVGNHLHFHIKLGNLRTYTPFIRAITAAIAMSITGRSRWQKSDGKFWDCRPFTRVIVGFRSWLGLQDYIRVNKMEGSGVRREHAEFIVREQRRRRTPL